MAEPATISYLAIIVNVFAFVAGFLTAVFAEPLRRWLFKPKLSLDFSEKPDCISLTAESTYFPTGKPETHSAYYVKVEVTVPKRRMAKGCRGYLVNIDKKNEETGAFEPTIYCDSIQLAWSCKRTDEERYQGVDIPYGVRQFLDVFSTRDDSQMFAPKIAITPLRYIDLFKEKGIFRFTVQVSAEEADPKFIKLDLDWKGVWDDFKVSKN